MSDVLPAAITLIVGIVGLFILGLIGYALSGGGEYPACCKCRAPLVNGYEAVGDFGFYCRTCCRAEGIRPWYWKDEIGPWPGKAP